MFYGCHKIDGENPKVVGLCESVFGNLAYNLKTTFFGNKSCFKICHYVWVKGNK